MLIYIFIYYRFSLKNCIFWTEIQKDQPTDKVSDSAAMTQLKTNIKMFLVIILANNTKIVILCHFQQHYVIKMQKMLLWRCGDKKIIFSFYI